MAESPQNDITLSGTDGSVWTYRPISGPDFKPEETGWVLIVSGSAKPIAPQFLTVEEVLGDLASMLPGDESHLVLVESMTEWMISDLRDGNHAASSDWAVRQRVRELEEELHAAFPER